MLQNNPFYWGTIRKVVGAFGVLFADIHIVRTDRNGAPVKTIKVPVEYGPKEKWVVRAKQNPMPGTDDQVEMVLPRMSYEITGFTYDDSRKLTSTGRTVKALTDDQSTLKAQFNPVPYNVGFQLNIMTKTVEDGLMIVEQILPFFTPDYTITVKDVPELNLNKDIPIVLNSVVHDDSNWEGNFQERRSITWTLSFTAKAYLYPPVRVEKTILDSEANVRVLATGALLNPSDPTAYLTSGVTGSGSQFVGRMITHVGGLGYQAGALRTSLGVFHPAGSGTLGVLSTTGITVGSYLTLRNAHGHVATLLQVTAVVSATELSVTLVHKDTVSSECVYVDASVDVGAPVFSVNVLTVDSTTNITPGMKVTLGAPFGEQSVTAKVMSILSATQLVVTPVDLDTNISAGSLLCAIDFTSLDETIVTPQARVQVLIIPSSVQLIALPPPREGTKQFQVEIVNASQDETITYTLTPQLGTFDSTTLVYTAPSTVNQQSEVTLRATSNLDPRAFSETKILLLPN